MRHSHTAAMASSTLPDPVVGGTVAAERLWWPPMIPILAWVAGATVIPRFNLSTFTAISGLFNVLCLLASANEVLMGTLASTGRQIVYWVLAVRTELQIAHVRQQLSFSGFHDFENMPVFKPVSHHSDVFDQLETWSRAMRSIRVLAMFE
jgi:hypothetical protein